MFSLSLIFGNFAYLYLSVSFIQMLKVSRPRLNLSTGRVRISNRQVLGHQCCRHTSCYLGLRHGCPEPQQVAQCVRHCRWCCYRLLWRAQVRRPRIYQYEMMSVATGEANMLTHGLVQVTGIVCEALRLVMVQRLLSSDEFKMDPLVSVYCKSRPLISSCRVYNSVFTLHALSWTIETGFPEAQS